jgi:hypothetical protein
MTDHSTTDPYLRALQAEDGQPISAGARISHVREALAAGRAFYADLTAVPQDKRPALIAELNELVRRASGSPAA